MELDDDYNNYTRQNMGKEKHEEDCDYSFIIIKDKSHNREKTARHFFCVNNVFD